MLFGTPFSAGFGDPNLMLKYSYFDPRRLAQGKLFLIFSPRDTYGDCWFGVYIAGIFVGNFYCAEGEECKISIPPPAFLTTVSFQVIRIGYMADPGYVIQNVTRQMESSESPVVTWRWTWIPQFVEIEGDSSQISNLTLQNVLVKTTTQVVGYKYFRTLAVDLSIDFTAMTVTVTVSNRGVLLAQGTVPYGTTSVPLSTVVPNVDEGIPPVSGSVTIPATPTAFANATAYYRWPSAMNIYRTTTKPGYGIVTAGSWAGGSVTLTVGTGHGFNTSDSVVVSGVSPSGYNGSYTVGPINATQITYARANPGAFVSGGLAYKPPSAPVATVNFEGIDSTVWTEPTALAAGTYYYQIAEVSDTQIVGAPCSPQTEIVNGPPASIADLHFVQEI